jgi:ABC-type multidrug transport system fused ATPase/permease subunit
MFRSKKQQPPTSNGRNNEAGEEAGPPPMQWKENPEMNASIPNGLLFMWLQPLFTRAYFLNRKYGTAIEQGDLPPLPDIDYTQAVEERFRKAYNEYKPKKTTGDTKKDLERRLIAALFHVCKSRINAAGFIKFLNTCLQFSFPLLLNAILNFFQDVQSGKIPPDAPGTERYKGYWLSCLLLLFIASKAISEAAYFHKVNRCSWQIRTAISSAVYSKSLRLAAADLQQTTLGEMVNLMQVDASKIEAFIPQIHVLWDGMFQVAGYMTILGTLLGWPCVIGLIFMMFATPVMGIIMSKIFGESRAMVKYTDERVKSVNEALQGILSVKMYTWEESFEKVIAKSRAEEMKSLRHIAYLRAASRAYMTSLPNLTAVITFIVYAYATSGEITAAILFASIVAFDQLRFPLMFYPMAMAQYAQAKVSTGRVAIFLGYNEVSDTGFIRTDEGDGEIVVQNATVYWRDPKTPMTKSEMEDKSLDKSEHSKSSENTQSEHEIGDVIFPKPVLTDINLKISPGEVCAVVG